MSNTMKAPVEVSSMTVYPDASGAPAVVSVGPYVYACDFVGGEIRVSCIKPAKGSRVESKVAADRARREYAKVLEKNTDAAWRAANVALYAA